ncbi:MAG: HD-GYP domain-containing protein [Pontibacterium sp.]
MNASSPPTPAQQLAQLALALSTESDPSLLLEQIVEGCMRLSNADAGSLYTLSDEHEHALVFSVIKNNSMASLPAPEDLLPISLYDELGNESNLIVAQSFLRGQTFNVDDVSEVRELDFIATRSFSEQIGYQAKSFVSVPLKDHEGDTIGVLQLINALDDDGKVIRFSEEITDLLTSIAAMAASVLTQQRLIEGQRGLFESFIQLIGRAIDHKSPVTSKHCQLVPEIAVLLANEVQRDNDGRFKHVKWTREEMYELRVAAWLHDCGKLTTPENIIDKATKLHTIIDRIELVEGRFIELKQHLEIEFLRDQLANGFSEEKAEALKQRCDALDDDLAFLKIANIGGEYMTHTDQARVAEIGRVRWTNSHGETRYLLTDDECRNLKIYRGTLTNEERQIMRDHIKVTQDMLADLPYPKPLSQAYDIAVNHHEHLDGSGYPRDLNADDLCLRARIMCIADIFEALTSADRPYKKGLPLSQSMDILGGMVAQGHLDAELFTLFARSGAYKEYARLHMDASQIDEVDIEKLPGILSP